MGLVEMFEGAGCLVWIPAFAGMTSWVGWVMWWVEGWRGLLWYNRGIPAIEGRDYEDEG